MTKLAQYTSELLRDLGKETGQDTGFKQNGSVSIATNRERYEELLRGASIFENVRVTAIHQEDGRVTGVATDQGDIQAEYVVNCAGIWGRDVGNWPG